MAMADKPDREGRNYVVPMKGVKIGLNKASCLSVCENRGVGCWEWRNAGKGKTHPMIMMMPAGSWSENGMESRMKQLREPRLESERH
jgi:hypothetical protein